MVLCQVAEALGHERGVVGEAREAQEGAKERPGLEQRAGAHRRGQPCHVSRQRRGQRLLAHHRHERAVRRREVARERDRAYVGLQLGEEWRRELVQLSILNQTRHQLAQEG